MAVHGASAGGLIVAALVNEDPDAVAACVAKARALLAGRARSGVWQGAQPPATELGLKSSEQASDQNSSYYALIFTD